MPLADSEDWIDPIFDAVVSNIQTTGYFDAVNRHEPKRKPGTGLTAAVWIQDLSPVPALSGLAATTARLTFLVRLYIRADIQSPDFIDPKLLKAASNIIRQYHDDFDFEGTIRNVDLLGAAGVSLSATAGYLEQDSTMFRIYDIVVPCLVNDVWIQATQP